MIFEEMKLRSRSEALTKLFPEFVGSSVQMSALLELVAKVARSDSSVLVRGESGTGKELIAKSIHRLSMRAERPFIALNCSAIPENLLESELFGHERGAFTGADRKHAGVFERVNGGTLFLDEIGDMALSLQAKLLRVLQEKKFTPVGGIELKKTDVRVIAATHVNLHEAMRKNLFRSDLFYRINVLPVDVPALRERKMDIYELVQFYLELANRMHTEQSECTLSEEAIKMLVQYDWPGNVRQLQNVIERMVVMAAGGEISSEFIPDEVKTFVDKNSAGEQVTEKKLELIVPLRAGASISYPDQFGKLPDLGLNLDHYIENLENNLIAQALERTQNNRNQAAKLLGMNRTTLVERLKKRKIATL